ncbi:MAG: helix-turn-helix transcriptional regulator, partial [Pseudonocardia sp.]|nr:helix-turn-helix transcriptional regulator [Pseudonocardia sp.]
IEDVARRADVGKGTIYLHWVSKLELFATVLMREAVALTQGQLARLRADPAEVQLHRTMRSLFLMVMRRPLARAFYTGDTELLGALSHDSKVAQQVRGDEEALGPPYHATLYAHGLLADDPADDPAFPYRLSATVAGFFVLERMLPADVDLEAKADALALTVRRSFEPAAPASPAQLAAAAPAVIDLFARISAGITHTLPVEEPP